MSNAPQPFQTILVATDFSEDTAAALDWAVEVAREHSARLVRNVVAGARAIDLKRGLDHGLRVATTALRDLSRPVTSRKEKVQVATVSAHNDAAIGDLVADAIERIGAERVQELG